MEIGPYAVVETVAAHAFTVVYRAEQRPLGRTVLLKTLKSTVSAGSPFAAELSREAAVLGRLDHEGVVRLHDFVHTRDLLYLVLEDARGVPLDAILSATRLEPDVAGAVALAVARALAHAHERGVVHRGLASATVAIAARGRVLLTDLSTADLSRAELPQLPEVVEASGALARPDFMAPEQILGEVAGPAADVWALGVLFHELLAGVRPFAAADPREIARRIRSAPAAPLPPAVPAALGRFVARCLAKDPDDRFPDGRAAAAALEEALAAVTHLPVAVLASRALAAAGHGEALLAPGAAPLARATPRSPLAVARAARDLAVVLALIVAGAVALRAGDGEGPADGDGVPEAAPAGAAGHDHGLVRVVARPWAEIYVDGELRDVTPVGRPIPVAPGRHFVTFRHPSAPDEARSIKIAAGQSVLLDVTMRVDRGDAGAARDGGASTESP